MKIRLYPGDTSTEAVIRLQMACPADALALAQDCFDRPPGGARLTLVSIRRGHSDKGRRVSMSLVWYAPNGGHVLLDGVTRLAEG